MNEPALIQQLWQPFAHKKSLGLFAYFVASEWHSLMNSKGLTDKWDAEPRLKLITWIKNQEQALEDAFFKLEDADDELMQQVSIAEFVLRKY